MNIDVKVIDPVEEDESKKLSDDGGVGDISGSEADLESDDNALDAAHSVGLYPKADEEHPAELGVAEEIEEGDKLH